MTPTAKVYRHPRSPFYQAWFLAWDGARREWKPVTKTTRCEDRTEALIIARELERVALEASGQSGNVRVGQDWAQRAVNSLLSRAGVREVITGAPWDTFAEQWLKLRARNIKAASVTAYTSRIEVFNEWLGASKTLPLHAFTPAQAQGYYDALLAEGRTASTADSHVKLFSSIFERAREEGLCQRNPWQLVQKTRQASQVRDAFTAGQIVTLLAYLRADPKRSDWLTVVLLGLCTGQRLNDCAGAQWVHFETAAQPWVWVFSQGKTGKRVRVPIVEPLASHLRRLEGQRSGLAVTPSLCLKTALLSTQFSDLLKKAGIAGEIQKPKGDKGRGFSSLTFHSLRHTCNSMLANAGVSGDVRSAILGHASQSMNDRYTHLADATTGDALVQAITKAVS